MKNKITKQPVKENASITDQKTYEDFNKKKPAMSDPTETQVPPVSENPSPENEPLETSAKVHSASTDIKKEKAGKKRKI